MKIKFGMSINFDEVEREFLKAEWYDSSYRALKEMPVFANIFSKFNEDRMVLVIRALLWQRRYPILRPLREKDRPLIWCNTTISTNAFWQLRIIPEASWQAAFPGCNTIRQVAECILQGTIDAAGHALKIRSIQKDISQGKHQYNNRLIVLSPRTNDSMKYPVSLIEGNHRAVAYALEKLRNKRFVFPDKIIAGIGKLKDVRQIMWYNNN